MLVSLVISLRADREGALPPSTGGAMHGVFFKLLSKTNPDLADRLHQMDAKPFTVSPMFSGNGNNFLELSRSNSSQALYFRPDSQLWFRITSLDSELSETLLDKFNLHPTRRVEVLEHSFEPVHTTVNPREHPWAGMAAWNSLLEDISQNTSKKQVRMMFFTPTTFKSSGRSLPVPLPSLVFGSLMTRWNNFAPATLNPDFLDSVEEAIGISGYNLQTDTVFLKGSYSGPKLVAFRGWCEYTILRDQADVPVLLDLLSRFAFFAGIGYKTPQGFGQSIAIDDRPPGR